MPFGITPSAPPAASETDPLALLKANNLSDLGNAGTARTNLGLGSAATQASSAFAASVGSDVALPWSGTGGSGSDDNPARQDHYHPASLWTPSGSGFKGWCDNPILYTASSAPTSGTIYVVRYRLDANGTLSSVTVPITTAGASLTNCYVGIYDTSSLAQLAVSTDQSASWGSTGNKTVSMAAATSSRLAGSDVYVAFLYNGTTLALRAATAAPLINLGLSFRQATAGTGQTSLPSTLGTLTGTTTPYFFAVN
jgi:hypothetical protein